MGLFLLVLLHTKQSAEPKGKSRKTPDTHRMFSPKLEVDFSMWLVPFGFPSTPSKRVPPRGRAQNLTTKPRGTGRLRVNIRGSAKMQNKICKHLQKGTHRQSTPHVSQNQNLAFKESTAEELFFCFFLVPLSRPLNFRSQKIGIYTL